MLKTAIKKSKGQVQVAQVRAAVPLLYAHWEGFVKQASTQYLEYVCRSGARFSELQNAFVFLGLKKKVSKVVESSNKKLGVEAVAFIRESLEEIALFDYKGAIDTGSNLSSSVLQEIICCIALDSSRYDAYANLIDERLLKRRNQIAHGEFLDLDAQSWNELSGEVLALLRMFKTDIENCASTRSFKKQ